MTHGNDNVRYNDQEESKLNSVINHGRIIENDWQVLPSFFVLLISIY